MDQVQEPGYLPEVPVLDNVTYMFLMLIICLLVLVSLHSCVF